MGRPKTRIKQRPATCWERENVLLDTERAAMILGIPPHSLRKLARDGKIPAHKLGKKLWRFNKNELMAALGTI